MFATLNNHQHAETVSSGSIAPAEGKIWCYDIYNLYYIV